MYKIIGVDQKEYGPITAEQLRQWVSEGRVNAQTQVCLEGTQEWKPLAMFSELVSLANTPLSPPLASKPPAAIKVFSILNLVFGSLGVLCSPLSFVAAQLAAKQLDYGAFMMEWMLVSVIIAVIGGGIIIASGIGPWKLRPWGRQLAIYYAIFACLFAFLNTSIMLTHLPSGGPNPEMQRFTGMFGAIFGIAISLTYNTLLVVFLSKRSVKEAMGEA